MSFAPYTNDRRRSFQPEVLGQFRNSETNCFFEYTTNPVQDMDWGADFAHCVFVGPDAETRFANVKKTVIEIAVDEDEHGNAVTEKWQIKQHRVYSDFA